MNRNWLLFVLFLLLAACSSTAPINNSECAPLSKVDFSKQPKDIMSDLNTCMNAKKFKQAAEHFYALASKSAGEKVTNNPSDELRELQNVIRKKHPQAAVDALDNEIKKIHKDNAELCARMNLFGNDDYQKAISNSSDKTLIDKINKTFDKDDQWRTSFKNLLDCN
ncbi:hypothetical protein JQC92_16795 [Shewanella sp. 202IG2-18]|uniref:hypothetical protein n=1 Tax=Parashewanella hymeniacidonis TaxID=2807618 RepID=UPI0019609D7B|nr:hypothetical protein [Parashewanella hymeniacidonis]MBM7073669.1 hypothetical protein [Parashewanella hymeniacidonis]